MYVTLNSAFLISFFFSPEAIFKKKNSESPLCEPHYEFQSDGFVSEQEAKSAQRLNTYKYQSV